MEFAVRGWRNVWFLGANGNSLYQKEIACLRPLSLRYEQRSSGVLWTPEENTAALIQARIDPLPLTALYDSPKNPEEAYATLSIEIGEKGALSIVTIQPHDCNLYKITQGRLYAEVFNLTPDQQQHLLEERLAAITIKHLEDCCTILDGLFPGTSYYINRF